MQSVYTVSRRDDSGRMTIIREIEGSLRQREDGWEMVTATQVIPGTLAGHPLAAHVFTDQAGREYRVA